METGYDFGQGGHVQAMGGSGVYLTAPLGLHNDYCAVSYNVDVAHN